jgi:hypothetical protein
MSRHKENNPLPSQQRVNGSVFGASKSAPSSEFYTDSLLEDTSRIPSPSPQKQPVSKPRRALQGHVTRPLHVSRDSANTAYQPPSQQNGNKSFFSRQQPPPLLSRPSLNTSQQDLITPPQSRDGEPKSPSYDVASPPPSGLNDVYTRIEEEEELAERENEDYEEEEEDYFSEGRKSPNPPRKSSSQRSLASKGSTPARPPADSNKENAVDDQTGKLSHISGMSFAQNLTDPRLAATLTPHFTEKAKDMRRLQNISNKPIYFNSGPRPTQIADDERSNASTERRSASPRLTNARTAPTEQVNGIKQKSAELEDFEDEDTSDEVRDAEKELQNRKLKKVLGRSHGHTGSAPPRHRQSQQPQQDDNDTQRSVQSEPSISVHQQFSMPDKNPIPVTTKGFLGMWSNKAKKLQDQRQDSSQLDWANIDADAPLPSVENSNQPPQQDAQSDLTGSVRSQRSIDRLRKFENDTGFTNLSLQVSESPPVRSKKGVEDYVRDREIANLSKKALTTNRLDEIRERDPREAHRRLSRSSSGDQLRAKQSLESMNSPKRESAGQQLPDTPVVIYRSSTGSSSKSNHDGSSSHDYLQRLARATSTTPKGSPAPAPTTKPKPTDPLDADLTQASIASSANAPELQQPSKPSVLATPKVIGAWTDTVLPDTARTVRTNRMPSRYAQTPHVSAGGWVDTPMQNGFRQSSALAPMTIEEVTEDLDTDVVPKKEDEQIAEIGAKSPAQAKRTLPPSVLSRVLEEQEMGDTTINSLQDLLENTMTILDDRKISLQNAAVNEAREMLEHDEIGFIDRLGGKLQEVAVSLHDTRKGISNLEKTFMRASDQSQSQLTTDLQPTPSRYAYEDSFIPILYSTITLPVPLLFHPRHRTDSEKQQKRTGLSAWIPFGAPTPLGWIVMVIWTWYILESFAAELYAHPLQAERYIFPPAGVEEPVFPYVLPTVILRSLGFDAGGMAYTTSAHASVGDDELGFFGVIWGFFSTLFIGIRALYRVTAMAMGLTDGFVDDVLGNAGTAMATAAAAATQGSKSMLDSVGGAGEYGMMNDDFI